MDIDALLHDQSFTKKIDEADSLEEVAQLFNDKGIEVTASDIQRAMDAAGNDELSEESLEDVAGGAAGILVAAAIGAYLLYRWKKRHFSGGGGGHRF